MNIRADAGAGVIEYALVVVLIGLVSIMGISYVGQTTSETFDEVGGAFPTGPTTPSPDDTSAPDVFDQLLTVVEKVGSPGNSLLSKGKKAKDTYLKGDVDGALSKLDSLVKQVDAQQGKNLTADQAAAIRSAVNTLVDNIATG